MINKCEYLHEIVIYECLHNIYISKISLQQNSYNPTNEKIG